MNVILETLSNGLFRCTVRHHGATMAFVDHSNPKQAVLAAIRQGAAGHMLHDGSFDMTHLQLNDAAKQALTPAPAPDWAVLGPKLAEALLGALPVVEDALGDALRAVRLAEGLGGDGAEIRVRDAFKAQASGIRALLAEAGHSLPAA